MNLQVLFAIVFTVSMFAGVFVIFLAMRQRHHILEMRHRERMAMIERGQAPIAEPPMTRHVGRSSSSRALSVGIIIVGLGLALMTILSVAAGSPDVGVGIGGAIVIVGAAFIVRSLVVKPAPTVVPPPPLDGGPSPLA